MRRLLLASLPRDVEWELREAYGLGDLITFKPCRDVPIYRWFYLKEAFSREFVWTFLRRFSASSEDLLLDPFCGVGNALLAAKEFGTPALGFDISPLMVLVSNVKLRSYDLALLRREVERFLSSKPRRSSWRFEGPGFIDVRRVFSQSNLRELAHFRQKVEEVEDERVRDFLLVGLASVAAKASRAIKDGGVLRLTKRRVLPLRKLLRLKLEEMLEDLERIGFPEGVEARAEVGDARRLPLGDEAARICITSPPYLNWVDYTKVYGIELSLLLSQREIEKVRRHSVRSFLGAELGAKAPPSERLAKLLEELGCEGGKKRVPEVVTSYFSDLWMCVGEIHRCLEAGGKAAIVVSNTCLPSLTIDVDLILAELCEEVGFEVEEILVANVRWCGVRGIKQERPVRESILVMERC